MHVVSHGRAWVASVLEDVNALAFSQGCLDACGRRLLEVDELEWRASRRASDPCSWVTGTERKVSALELSSAYICLRSFWHPRGESFAVTETTLPLNQDRAVGRDLVHLRYAIVSATP